MSLSCVVHSCLAAAMPLALVALCAAQQKGAPAAPEKPALSPYDEALARYRTCMDRLPFWFHTVGRTRLANTREPAALQILAADYVKPKYYPEYSRYMLANLFGANFSGKDEFTPVLDELRKTNSKPIDTWLWVHALRIQSDRVGDTDAVTIATTSKNLIHRAAAILALGDSRNGNIKSPIVTNCLEWPKKESDRCLLLGAMSGALWENRRRVNDEEYRVALTAYIGLLAPEVDLTHTQKIQIARHLQKILKGPALFVNPEPWLELLQRGDVKVKTDKTTAAPQRFFGIETDGERYCYVLDMSDSMCKKIEPSAKPPTQVLTGPRKKTKRALLDESALPWDKIDTRWDLAREQMRISLSRLSDEKYFSIVWFGTEAGTLDSCKGMIKATKGNVDKVLAELDSIKEQPPDKDKAPDGQLRGKTNMHAGLRYAFSLSDKGFVEDVAYVDPGVLAYGCDTIFLLSDGAPSWDEFGIEDTNYHEGKTVVDNEYNKPAPDQPRVTYHGPFLEEHWLVEDVERMNAFRRIRMHCIGLGEANMSLLGKLAEIGHGEVYVFGRAKDTKDTKDAKDK